MKRGLKLLGGLALVVFGLAALFTGASLLFPKRFRPRVETTELRAPSGAVYRIMARETLPAMPGGRKTLGIQYLAADLSDAARLSRAADELEAVVRPQLEAENYDGLVVTAYAVTKQVAFMTVARTVVTVYQRPLAAPEAWEIFSRSPVQAGRGPAAAELNKAYGRLIRAVFEKDARAVFDLETPDYRDTTVDGRVMDRREDMGFMQKQFAQLGSVGAFTSLIVKLDLRGREAAVLVKTSFSGTVNDERRAGEIYYNEGWSRDLWLKTPGGWRLKSSSDVGSKSFFFKP